jgi:hypothetical protein
MLGVQLKFSAHFRISWSNAVPDRVVPATRSHNLSRSARKAQTCAPGAVIRFLRDPTPQDKLVLTRVSAGSGTKRLEERWKTMDLTNTETSKIES